MIISLWPTHARRLAAAVVAAALLAGCGAVAPGQSTGGPGDAAAAPSPSSAATGSDPAAQPTDTVADAPTGAPGPAATESAPAASPVTGAAEVPADLLAQLVADVAGRAGVTADQIAVAQAEAVEWSDSSLGCPQPDMAYMQVITSGYRVVLEAAGTSYNYHAADNGGFVLCEQK